jgi:hypothetical protein
MCGVSKILEAGNGFPEFQDEFMRFLKYYTFWATSGE